MSIKSVVPSSQLMHLLHGRKDNFGDDLCIGVRGVSVFLAQLASFPSKPDCLFISLDPAVCWNPLLVCLDCEADQGSFHLVEILLMEILGSVEDRESICEDDQIGLGSGYVVSYLNCGFLGSFSFCFKVG